jgi:hypothetical protein
MCPVSCFASDNPSTPDKFSEYRDDSKQNSKCLTALLHGKGRTEFVVHTSLRETSEMLRLEHTFYGSESWTLRKVDQKYLESSEMWCWRRVEKISWTDSVKNEELLQRVK